MDALAEEPGPGAEGGGGCRWRVAACRTHQSSDEALLMPCMVCLMRKKQSNCKVNSFHQWLIAIGLLNLITPLWFNPSPLLLSAINQGSSFPC
jgi:hypothetical protein